ncbi:3-deoxy-manno-octulosonate cytidylyltransferase [Fulvivirga sedimenti]|uniref:3-deoxy-manno-octulosonate cytidylyltransferase n=1 Tax=Fulvivirga sedimenti TaxID=2879465 RepID=A0A9X1HM49_9BACT|nr:3-deoxy-manno-octulosonate cytidylyltransferase [Fulvivirga sedimenti]MCA6073901.1 3-deoxy-manno-octulosonate cytidylyltransferase [Fulvivirga sedimenti]
MKITGIIPARYESSRLPGKALEMIGDKPMIMHVYEQAIKAEMISKVVVATDDHRILDVLLEAGIPVVMTARSHKSGTDRCHEAVTQLNEDAEYIVNIQGDEPFIDPAQIDLLARLCNGKNEIATLVTRLQDDSDLQNPNIVKVVRSISGKALYFSRSPIPYFRDPESSEWTSQFTYWRHLGMYAYRRDILQEISALKSGKLESAESLEQLRWLENDFSIVTADTGISTLGVDTPDDLEKARKIWEGKQN